MTTKKANKKSLEVHPSHKKQTQRLNRIEGQIRGVGKMIEEKRYCPDILIQIDASISALRSLQASILETHMRHCVKEAIESRNENDTESKIEELMEIFRRHI